MYRKRKFLTGLAFIISFGVLVNLSVYAEPLKKVIQLEPAVKVDQIKEDNIVLPKPRLKSNLSIEEAIARRRSRRLYKKEPITLKELSQILWAAQGITGQVGGFKLRTAPSAGALYPIELYVLLPKGVYHYLPEEHKLEKIKGGDLRSDLAEAALGQQWIREASCNIIITAVYERTMAKYGKRGIKYAILEAGHVSENIYLQAESLGLGTVNIGAFGDVQVQKVLGIPKDNRPLYIMPLGYPLHR
ncbi:MAG TPA: SagB/ThcOx family dehydrogenase [bacterium]|nr:SagB/ThcOx family dehydrogenase [bacterium]